MVEKWGWENQVQTLTFLLLPWLLPLLCNSEPSVIWDSTSEAPLSSVQVLKYSLTASITCWNNDSSSRPWRNPAKQLLLHYCHQPIWHHNLAMSHVCLLSATNSGSSQCSLVFELQQSTSPCDHLHYHFLGWESEGMRNFGVGSQFTCLCVPAKFHTGQHVCYSRHAEANKNAGRMCFLTALWSHGSCWEKKQNLSLIRA